ncbi:hypothetical protein HOG16_00965 [Candidatus Woesearchaeota archaeon]|nr:hypothetical protein [Candidatus Woesearchaeota archaeon]MBT4322076.1 hypothetical protein [Candidatus Woesearchaeota archaeon]
MALIVLLYGVNTGLGTGVKEVRLNYTLGEGEGVSAGNWSNTTTLGFNCTGSPINATDYVDNVTLVVWNLTSGTPIVYLNTTNATNGTVGATVIRNFSTTIPNSIGLNWSWNCWIRTNNSAVVGGNVSHNMTGNITFGVDADAPVIVLISPVHNSEDMDGIVNFTYNVSDKSSDVANCSLYFGGVINGTTGYNGTAALNSTANTQTKSFNVALNSSYMRRPLQWYIGCYDNVTNRLGTSLIYNVYTAQEESSEGTGSGPSGSSNEDLGDIDDFGITGTKKEISTGKTVDFNYNGDSHSLKLNSIVDDDTAKITVSSTPITTTIDVGKTKNFDLDEDGSNDLTITLNNIDGSTAEITFRAYTTPEEVTTTEDTTETEEPVDTTPVRESPEDIAETSGSSTTWIVIAAIIIVAIVAYITITKKKKKL